MKKTLLNKFILVTTMGTILVTGVGRNIFIKDINAFTTKKGTVDVSALNVRSNAGTGNNTIATLERDTSVTVLDEVNSDGMYWYKISFNTGSGDREGYVAKNYIKTESTAKYTTDKTFESEIAGFPESYKNRLRALHAEYPNWKFVVQNVDISWDEVIRNESIVGVNLVKKNAKSSWKSTARGAYNWSNGTWPGFDSNEWVAASESIIRYYMDPRNFLDSTNIFQFLNHGYTTGEQTEEGVEKMLKGTFMESKSSVKSNVPSATSAPTTSATTAATTAASTTQAQNAGPVADLNEKIELVGPTGESLTAATLPKEELPTVEDKDNGPGYTEPAPAPIFESTTEFNDTEHGPGVVNSDSIKESVSASNSTYASTSASSAGENANALSNGTTYVDMIMDAAKSSGVNPYVIAAMLIQEQGVKGTSGLISGATGIYNFFNIEAYQSGNQSATSRGLAWAGSGNTYLRPWNTKAKAIIGGAMFYGSTYSKAGQNTFYLKKFNVLGENKYKHQYMTNIEGAKNEGAMLSRAYSEEDKKGVFTFHIPVYKDMPEVPEAMPTGDGSPNNRLSSLSISGYNITPGFSSDNYSYTVELPSNVNNVNIKANAADASATVSGSGDIELNSSNSAVDIIVTAQNGTKEKYSINIKRGN
ncbi:cadherin-like beta sandwich domain protein [Lachnoanaerobaculum sp. MSX33]|uniref:SH3 domain-containing protein n=1 Tax=Lachnoanaerobaculum sp. MSX33 TaxID=936596 RepID=UPI0003DFB36D|nr:SH3 domain-containing protein [Lachnoanaerobaculum sp. MSX33]ETO94956.1 cadherin-like beta sandwich domain protein [Lachnoanaerobaculum sp. MSX33]